MSDEENCTFTVIRTSDAKRIKISFSLSKKLGELKETLAEKFDISLEEPQRIFYMGRELKSVGRSLQKLGLGKFNNNVLHVHVPPTKEKVSGIKRRRATNSSHVSASTNSSNRGEGVIEIIDDSDDEVCKRRR